MSEIFREIDEELRRENLLKLWSRYGKHAIAVVVAIMLMVGGFVAWRDHQRANGAPSRHATTARWRWHARARVRKPARCSRRLSRDGGGYGVLAAFEQADLLAKGGDARARWQRTTGSPRRPTSSPEFRDVATLLSVMHALPDGDPKATIAKLEPLTASGSPWRATALELTAVAQLKIGDKAIARDIYQKLADDLAAPQGLRARAAEMVTALADVEPLRPR